MTKRNLNARGQNLIDRIEKAIGTILFVVVIIYAGVRGQKFATQLPATYRTTTRPNNIPIDFVNQIFPSNIPDPTYEFPAVTICPEVGALAGIVSCFVTKSPSGIKVPCDDKGMYSRFLPYLGSQVECQTVNDIPGKPLAAENSGDIMMVTVTLTGTSPGSPRSAFVTAHPHGGPTVTPVQSFDNFFAAGTSSMTQVAAKKVYQIDQHNNIKQTYEVKPSSAQIAPFNGTHSPYLLMQFQYPKLEVTYEKAFLALDMDNWLGEVGGLAFLLLMLLRAVMFAVRWGFQRSDKFSYSDLGAQYERNEGLNQF